MAQSDDKARTKFTLDEQDIPSLRGVPRVNA